MMKANHKTIKQGRCGPYADPYNRPTREEMEIAAKLKSKHPSFIQDLCDICLQKGFVFRKWMDKRKFGLRFGCKECLQKGLFPGWDETFPHSKGKFVHLYKPEV